MLSKLFECQKKGHSQNKEKDISLTQQVGIPYEKQKEFKYLEDSVLKKLDENYLKKLTLLLHSSKYTSKQATKRNNINKTVYKYDDKNELYLTLPKINDSNYKYTKNDGNDDDYMKT